MAGSETEIMRMEPGPDLDRLVAEKVMGWRETIDYILIGPSQYPKIYIEEDGMLWSPSTDIAAAWDVVDELHRKDLVLVLTSGWEVSIFAPRDNFWEPLAEASAPTLPLAICRAALQAMGTGARCA